MDAWDRNEIIGCCWSAKLTTTKEGTFACLADSATGTASETGKSSSHTRWFNFERLPR